MRIMRPMWQLFLAWLATSRRRAYGWQAKDRKEHTDNSLVLFVLQYHSAAEPQPKMEERRGLVIG